MLAGADSVMYVTASAAVRPDAVAAGHARHDKRYGTYRQRTPYSRNEEDAPPIIRYVSCRIGRKGIRRWPLR